MSALGSALSLPDGSRLTAVSLTAHADDCREADAQLFLHRIRFHDVVEPAPATQALSCFIPSSVVTLSGLEPDGQSWGAVFQYAPWPRHPRRIPLRARALASAGVQRALSLTGVAGDVMDEVYGDATLRRWYSSTIDGIETWTAMDLLLGLVLQLATNVSLDELAGEASDLDAHGSNMRDRGAHFRRRLREWASTYEGPGAY